MWWRKRSLFVIGLSLLIAVLIWSQMGMYIAHLLFGVNLHVNVFKFCVSLFKESSFYYFLVTIILNVLIAYTILITLIKIIEQFILLKKFKKVIFAQQNIGLTSIINRKFESQHQDIIVIDHSESFAFTFGFRSPSIVLSSSLIEILDSDELVAVVEHETFHQKNDDSLKIFILQLIAQSIWFIPLTKWSYQNYKIMSELLADEYAIQKMGSELGLSSALFKLINNYYKGNASPTLVHFSGESVNFRLQQLVEPKKSIPVRLKTTSMVISIYVLLLLMGMIFVTIT
ncbi:M56 family metallopeptidase [Bacillus cihuensis]|uniref:M56 family metallopeptidase n=1 Tax=Bacillus cihuensis TaxID=1208599 RepID=UPI0004060A03|nr:M56 family metallopeptidase [Bacillus cihuensis]